MAPAPLDRRRMLGNVALAAAVAAGAFVAERWRPLSSLGADFATGTDERRTITLADGSVLWLGARSAVDVDFSGSARRLQLRQGELVVQVAADPDRPFGVSTAQATVRALDARFSMRQVSDRTLVTVLQHRVEVRSETGMKLRLEERQAAQIDADGRIRQLL